MLMYIEDPTTTETHKNPSCHIHNEMAQKRLLITKTTIMMINRGTDSSKRKKSSRSTVKNEE